MIRGTLALTLMILLVGCGSDFEASKQSGLDAYQDGHYGKARDKLNEACRYDASDRDVLYHLGLAYQRDSYHDSALFYFRQADLLFPKDREINSSIIEAAEVLEDFRAAYHATRVLISTGDSSLKHLEKMAEYSRGLNWGPNMYFYGCQLLEREPDRLSRYLEVAHAATVLDSMGVAERIIDSAIERFGRLEPLLANKAAYRAFQGDHKTAETIFRSIVDADSLQTPAYRLGLANSLSSQDSRGKKTEALAIYESLREQMGEGMRLDSMITDLRDELNAGN
jgi:tetratricopeptide (TPR) repeat protein